MAQATPPARGATARPAKAVELPKISPATAWIYGSVSLPLAMISYPLGVWLPRLYSTEVGIDLGSIGLVIFAAAIVDAVSEPVMGFFSDRWQTRWGRRRPVWPLPATVHERVRRILARRYARQVARA